MYTYAHTSFSTFCGRQQSLLPLITGGRQVTFSPITTLIIPPSPDSYLRLFNFLSCRLFLNQEGVVAAWDVRSISKSIKVFQTGKTRVREGLVRLWEMTGRQDGCRSQPAHWQRCGLSQLAAMPQHASLHRLLVDSHSARVLSSPQALPHFCCLRPALKLVKAWL